MNTFQDGVRLYKEGKYIEAVEKLHAVASAEHTNHKAWNALGVALSKTGDLDQSIICFENALSLDPANKTYIVNLGRAKTKRSGSIQVPVLSQKLHDKVATVLANNQESDLQGIRNLESSEDNYSSSPSISPDTKAIAEDSLNRAFSLFGQASYHNLPDLQIEALSSVEKSLELYPDYYDAWQLKVSILMATGEKNPNHLVEALEACERALSIKPEQASMWFNKAGILESLGRYDEAISAYDRSYGYSTEEPMRLGLILMKKAAILESLGNPSLALKVYEQVPVNDRFFGDAMENRAKILEQSGDRELAITSLRTAGLCHLKQNQYEKARHSLDHLLSLVPGDVEAASNKGLALLALYDQNPSRDIIEEALTCFDTALQAEPENMTYLIQKGRCLLDLGRFEEGLQYLDRALWIDPSDGITLMNKGVALYQLSRHDEALKYFDLVCSHYPEHAAPWIMKSRIHLDWKQYDTALMEINQAIQRENDDPKVFAQRATIMRALGKESEAREDEKKSRELSELISEN